MDELLPFIFAAVYFLVSVIGKAKRQAGQRRTGQGRVGQGRVGQGRVGQGGVGQGPTPTARAETFEDLLAEMRDQLDRARQAEETDRIILAPRPQEPVLVDTIEERESLEVDPFVVSMEEEVEEWQRDEVTIDSEAEALVRRRIEEAERRNREWRPEDHRRFDAVIRTPATEQRQRSAPRFSGGLKAALVWRELLDPPVSMRDPK